MLDSLSGLSLAGSIQMGYSKEGSQVVSATEGRIAVYGIPGPLEIEGGGALSGSDLLVDRGDDATLSLFLIIIAMIQYSVFWSLIADYLVNWVILRWHESLG